MLFASGRFAFRVTSINSMLNVVGSSLSIANSAKALEICREFKGNWHLSKSR
jgi:hypothetical protein